VSDLIATALPPILTEKERRRRYRVRKLKTRPLSRVTGY